MSKKADSDLDLDFSEINNPDNPTISENMKLKPKKQRISKRGGELRNTMLVIPSQESTSKFISKSISECSATEFIKWADHVAYPLNKNKQLYESERNRINQFLRIVAYHRRNFMITNPKAAETLH